MFKIGMIGPGRIAEKMAYTVQCMENASCYAVASRSLEKAEAFAQKYGFEKAYGSYEELVKDPEVQLVYVATPTSHHFEQVRMCLMHDKPVLCEKTFTANAKEAEELVALSRERGVFMAEAIWTRYMPFSKTITEWVNSGVIGRPKMLTANLCYPVEYKERVTHPELCGGALFDLGVYPINLSMMVFGTDITHVSSSCVKNDLGVDLQNSINLTYADGRMAMLQTSVCFASDRNGVIFGDKGYIVIDNINNPQNATLYDSFQTQMETRSESSRITGFEYQVEASMRAIAEGKIEPDDMPHEEILRVMRMLDDLKKAWGVRFPMDEE